MVKRDSGNQMLKENVRALSGFRGKRGPVDECCYKPCTVDELLTYC
nr:insulin-like peptide 3 [Hyphantria cunea]